MKSFFLSFFFITAVASAQTPTEFRLSPGDAIEVKFFYNPELNDSMQIRPDGKVSFPLLGDIVLGQKTVAEAMQELQEKYKPILKNPAVNINVKGFAAQKVFVGGEVNRPGTLALPGDMTIFEAIADAGGIKHTGSNSTVVLIRRGPNGEPVKRVVSIPSASKVATSTMASSMMLRPYDVIIVPESKIARVDRWVDQNIRQVIPASLNAGFSYLFNPIAVR